MERIVHQHALPFLLRCREKLPQKLHALTGAAHKVDAQRRHLVGMGLGIAAAGRHDGVGVHFFSPTDHLAGFFVTDGGDGAGVDDIGIRRLLKRHQLVSLRRKLLLHGLGLVLVDLAAEGI